MVMGVRPEKVVRRYERCVEQGKLASLKFLLNFRMFKCFNADRNLARKYSEILSAIDDDRVQELDDQPLALIDQVFTPKTH
jgi:DNA-binding sugar fermentation-stimulating protein